MTRLACPILNMLLFRRLSLAKRAGSILSRKRDWIRQLWDENFCALLILRLRGPSL